MKKQEEYISILEKENRRLDNNLIKLHLKFEKVIDSLIKLNKELKLQEKKK